MTAIKDESAVGEQRAIDSIYPYEGNAKIHDKKQVKELAESINEFGWRSRILIDADGVIIAGHGRLEAAKHLGLETVPVTIANDLTPVQVKALRLADNKVSSTKYDTNLLMDELEGLHVGDDFDMSKWFDDKELEFATFDLGEVDLDALTDDISIDVVEHSESTHRELESEKGTEYPATSVLGFSKVNADQRRVLSRMMMHLEEMTGLRGAEALADHAHQFIFNLSEAMPSDFE